MLARNPSTTGYIKIDPVKGIQHISPTPSFATAEKDEFVIGWLKLPAPASQTSTDLLLDFMTAGDPCCVGFLLSHGRTSWIVIPDNANILTLKALSHMPTGSAIQEQQRDNFRVICNILTTALLHDSDSFERMDAQLQAMLLSMGWNVVSCTTITPGLDYTVASLP